MKNFLSAWVGCLLALNVFSGEIPPWIPAAPAVQGAYPLIQAGEIPGTPPVIRTIPLEGEWKTACVAASAVPFPDDVDRKAGFAEKEFADGAWKAQTVPGKTVYSLFREVPDARRP